MKIVITLLLVLGLFSCSDNDQDEFSNMTCVWEKDINRFFDKNDELPCVYTDVYKLDGELYAICHCCICRKIEQVLSCSGTNICIDINQCTSRFLDSAEYQFSFE